MGSNPSSDCSKAGHSKVGCFKTRHSEASCFELKAERASPEPSREASEDHSEVASDGEIQDQECFNSQWDQDEVVRNLLQVGHRFHNEECKMYDPEF